MPRWIALLGVMLPAVSASANPFPGGVLDNTGRTAYLASGGGIDAIDLTTGQRLWRTDRACEPMFVAGERLYARAATQPHEFRIRAFDLGQKRRQVFESAAIVLPRWVDQACPPGHTFALSWRRTGTTLDLTCHASAVPTARDGGAPVLGPAKKKSLALRLDLTTGHLQALVPAAAQPGPVPKQLEKLSVRWYTRVAGQLRALVLEESAGGAKLVWRVWDERTGKEAPAREVWRGGRPVILNGADGKTRWVRDLTSSPDRLKSGTDTLPAWTVLRLPDGKITGTVPYLPGTRAGLVIEGKAYVLTSTLKPRFDGPAQRRAVLKVIDCTSGKVLWSRPLGQ